MSNNVQPWCQEPFWSNSMPSSHLPTNSYPPSSSSHLPIIPPSAPSSRYPPYAKASLVNEEEEEDVLDAIVDWQANS